MMKLPYTEVKFYPEVKSQTGLSSLRVSCKRALNEKIYSSVFNDIMSFLLKQTNNGKNHGKIMGKIMGKIHTHTCE